MTTNEKRFLRRELITDALNSEWKNSLWIRSWVRAWESYRYGQKLNIYSTEG